MKGITLPERTEDFTADPVELFFDLAYVFAYAQLVSFLVHDPTWSGAGKAALLFGLILTVVSFAWLAFTTNLVAAFLSLLAIGFYVIVYTLLLKRSTPQNIVIGGLFGAAPPLFGWAAVTGTIEPGKSADFIVIDQNILEIPTTDIHKTKVLATVLQGHTVFEAK